MAERAGRRETNLRAVNDRIAEAVDRLDDGSGGSITVVCECALARCDRMFEVSRCVFDRVRASPVRFVVAEGHVLHEVESAIETAPGWVVVEKRGDAARVATLDWQGLDEQGGG